MNQLTAFERALLEQFETLASGLESAQDGSRTTSEALRGLSDSVHRRLNLIEQKQREIESFQARLFEALNGQSERTESLVQQVNGLLHEQRK